MLVSTVAVIGIDWWQREQAQTDLPAYDPQAAPILPSVARPELDADSPVFRPDSEIISTPEQLAEPLTLSLQPGGELRLEGTIMPGAADQLAAELSQRGEYVVRISLNSPGGIVSEALQMGDMIREAGLETHVATGSLCASSCPLVLAGGTMRSADPGAVIGVHQIYTSPTLPDVTGPGILGDITRNAAQALSDAQVITAQIGRYLDRMDINPILWFHALETPPDKLYYLTPDEMVDIGLITPAVEG